jgi:hypothetical protein
MTLNPPMWGMKTVLLKGPLFWPFPMVPIVEGVNLHNILLRRKILPIFGNLKFSLMKKWSKNTRKLNRS